MEISDRIREIRESQGMTRAQFAERLGITAAEITNVEFGKIKNMASKESLFRSIAAEFGVSLDWIKTGEGDMYAQISSIQKDPVVEGFLQFLRERTPEQKALIAQQLRELVACIDQAEAKNERKESPPTLKKVAARGDVDQSILDNANTDIELPDRESDAIP